MQCAGNAEAYQSFHGVLDAFAFEKLLCAFLNQLIKSDK
jgi:hypothetical protein